MSPRKIPSLYKLFEKAGGDLTISQSKNYAKDPRHLVLLKGFRYVILLIVETYVLLFIN